MARRPRSRQQRAPRRRLGSWPGTTYWAASSLERAAILARNRERFYPADADGTARKFDDLPPELHRNVNIAEAPYDRRPGDAPALTDAEIEDVFAFLRTLDNGFEP